MKYIELFPKKYLLMILSSVVLFLMVFMGFSLYKFRSNKAPVISGSVEELKKQSTSTDIQSIERDLNDTDLSQLDKEVTDIEKELNQL